MSGKFEPAPIGLGCMGFAAFYGEPKPQEEVNAVIKRALELKCTHFDTAEVYRSGNIGAPDENTVWSEKQLGIALKGAPRDSFQLATKFLPPLHGNKADRTAVESALDASLERLQMDYVDLYYMHRCVSKELTLEFVKTCDQLRKEGKIRHIGLSECPPSWLEEAAAVAPIATIQMEWSALTRNVEKSIAPVCAKHGITIVAYSPLSRNLLADPVELDESDWRSQQPRWRDHFEENKKIINSLKTHAEKIGASPAQLSLAWLYTRAKTLGVNVLPIPGTTKVENLENNVASLKFVPLDDETVEMINKLEVNVKGERYNESGMASTFDSLENL